MKNLIFSPIRLVDRAKTLEGFDMIYSKLEDKFALYETATEIAEEWTDDWSEDQGFGSSDFTYALKCFIDRMISLVGGGYKTDFTPRLSILLNK